MAEAEAPQEDTEGAISPEELEQLNAELASLTPEALYEMQRTVAALSDGIQLPEAGGIVFTEFVNDKGAVLNLTARGSTPVMAIEALMDGARKLKGLGYTIRRNRATLPGTAGTPVTVGKDATDVRRVEVTSAEDPGHEPTGTLIEVTSYRRDATQAGNPYLRVFGGMYTKFGIPAYEQVIPTSANFDIKSLNPGEPRTDVPDWMRKALVTPEKPLKVIRFL